MHQAEEVASFGVWLVLSVVGNITTHVSLLLYVQAVLRCKCRLSNMAPHCMVPYSTPLLCVLLTAVKITSPCVALVFVSICLKTFAGVCSKQTECARAGAGLGVRCSGDCGDTAAGQAAGLGISSAGMLVTAVQTIQLSTVQYRTVHHGVRCSEPVEEVAMQLLCRQLAWKFPVQACL